MDWHAEYIAITRPSITRIILRVSDDSASITRPSPDDSASETSSSEGVPPLIDPDTEMEETETRTPDSSAAEEELLDEASGDDCSGPNY